jgi:hypothetical protein
LELFSLNVGDKALIGIGSIGNHKKENVDSKYKKFYQTKRNLTKFTDVYFYKVTFVTKIAQIITNVDKMCITPM